MKKTLGWLYVALAAGGAIAGCAGSNSSEQSESVELGKIALPLTTFGPSGAKYQLRNANFQILPEYYYYYDRGIGGAASTGTSVASAGVAVQPNSIRVSSDSNPDAPSIEVDLEEGYYQIYLEPGWALDRIDGTTATPVEAQLLSGEWQWIYVSPRSTSWVTYQFGIGDRSLWFNGKLNVDVQVYENPDDYYGPSYGGMPATGGGTYWPVAGSSFVAAGGSGARGTY